MHDCDGRTATSRTPKDYFRQSQETCGGGWSLSKAISTLQRTGCQWRLLPVDFPPWRNEADSGFGKENLAPVGLVYG